MSTLPIKKTVPLLIFQFISVMAFAQVRYSTKEVKVLVSGTSTMHDWTMKSSTGECNAVFTLNSSGQLTGIGSMSFAIAATSLKSGHSGMDKNAYKALKTDRNASITYTLTAATITAGNITCQGKLTIAGTTVDTGLQAVSKMNADKSITISISKKIKMKDFNMSPPTFMMGAVKTGNEVTLQFDLVLIKQ